MQSWYSNRNHIAVPLIGNNASLFISPAIYKNLINNRNKTTCYKTHLLFVTLQKIYSMAQKILIYLKDGTPKEIQCEGARVKKTLNKEDYISFRTISETYEEIPVGSYIYSRTSSSGVSEIKYTLNQSVKGKKISSKHYQFDYIFEANWYDLKKSVFRVLNQTDSFFIGDAESFLTQIVDSLNADGYTFTVGTVDATDEKNLKFTGESCWAMLNRVCDEFDLEFKFVGSIINLTYRYENDRTADISLSQGDGNGILSITQQRAGDQKLVTRLYYEGSTKNLPSGYGYKRLQGSSAYVSSNEATYGIFSDIEYFDDIYPTYEGTISDVTYDSNGIPTIEVSANTIDWNSYFIQNVQPNINMLDGDCAGYTFGIKYFDFDNNTFILIPQQDQSGNQIPSDSGLNVAIGDTFNVTECDMPASLITDAVSRLDAAAALKVAERDNTPREFVVNIDAKILNDIYTGGQRVLDVGDKITITDSDLDIPTNQRITGIEYDLHYKPHCTIIISDSRFAIVGRSEEIDAYITKKATETNELYDPRKITRDYKTSTELWNETFSIEDGKFDVDRKARQRSFDPYALSMDAGEIQFSVKDIEISTNVGGSGSSVGVSSGTFIHHSYNADTRYNIEKNDPLTYEPKREWSISADTLTASDPLKSYFVYAKIPLTDGVTTGEYILDEDHLWPKSVDNFILYKIGYVSAEYQGKRKSAVLWGSSSGDHIEIENYSNGKTGWDYDYISNVTLSFDEGTRTLSIAPTSTDFYYYIQGTKYIKKTTQTATITNTEGLWFFYFNGDTLVSSQVPWSISAENIAMVAVLYWDATNLEVVGDLQPELHSWVLDPATHSIFHNTIGTRYDSGLGYALNGTDKIDITSGVIRDEDITISIVDSDTPAAVWEQPLSPLTTHKLYRDGAAGDWRDTVVSDVPVILSGTALQYNEYTGSLYTLTNVGTNKYCAYWIVATGHQTHPVISIPGQSTNIILADAIDQNTIDSMNFGALPTPEHKVLYRIIVQSKTAAPYYEIVDVKDYRTSGDLGGNVTQVGAHGALSGLLADDHPQYFHLDQNEDVNGNNTFHGYNEFESIKFNLTPTPEGVTSETNWNSDEATIDTMLLNGVSLQHGQETYLYVKNQTGGTLVNGRVAVATGALGASGRVTAGYAIADGTHDAHFVIGVFTQDISNGDDGYVTAFGKVRGIDTTGTPYGEVWAEGDVLYVSSTSAGYLTKTPPESPFYQIPVAMVLSVHSTIGVIMVRPTFGMRLVDLYDVNGTPLTTDGQIMVWDNTNQFFDFTHNINDYLLIEDEHPALSLISEDVTILSLDETNQILTYNVPPLDRILTAGNTTTRAIETTSYIKATTGRFTELTNSYIPYHVSDAVGLDDSPFYTDGTNVSIGVDATSGVHIPRWSQITGADWYQITQTDIDNWNNGIQLGGLINQIWVSDGAGSGSWQTHWVMTIPDSNSQYYTLSDSFDYGSAVFTFDTNAGTRGMGLEMTSDYDTYIKLVSGSYYNQIQTIGSNFQIVANSGVGSTSAMTISNADATLGNVSFGHSVDIYELTLGSGSTYTFPTSDGAANKILVTDGAGTLSWQDWYYYTFDPDFFTITANEVSNKLWTLGSEGYYSSYQFAFGDVTDTHPNSQVWIKPNSDTMCPLLITTKHQTGIQIYRESNDGVFNVKRALLEIWNSTTDDENPLIYLYNESAAQSNLIETDGDVFTLYSDGRVKGSEAVNADEFVTKSQLTTGGNLLKNLNDVLNVGYTSYFQIELGNYMQATQFRSTVAYGTAPFTVVSSSKVINLNSDRLDDHEGSYYLDYANFTGKSLVDVTGFDWTNVSISDISDYTNLVTLDGSQIITGVKTFTTGPYVNNAVYWSGKTTAGTTRLLGINASDILYIGSIDKAVTATYFMNGGSFAGQITNAGVLDWNYTIQTDGYLKTLNTTDATSTTTGSLITAGGLGVAKNAYIGGNTNITGTVQHASAAGDGTKSALLSDVTSLPISTFTNDSGYLVSADLSGYVPYTGATANLDMGANNITTTGNISAVDGTFSGTGSFGGAVDITTTTGYNRAMIIGPKNTTINDGAYIEFTSSSTDGYGAKIGGIREGVNAKSALLFSTGEGASHLEKMRLNNLGNLGVNTQNPEKRIHVVGGDLQLRLATSATTYWDIGRDVLDGSFKIKDDGLGDVLVLDQTIGQATFLNKVKAGADATNTDDVPRWGQITEADWYGITSTDISNWNTAYGWGDWSTGVNKAFIEGVLTGNITSHTHSYDNYGSWTVRDDSLNTVTIGSGIVLDVLGGTNCTTSISGGDLTINVASSNWDAAYTHSQITVNGNPHGTTWTDILGTQNDINLSDFNDDLVYDNYQNWSAFGDTGSYSITAGATLTIAGGTNVTTSVSGSTLTINASGGSLWTQSGSDIYYSAGGVGFGGAPASGFFLYCEYTTGRYFGVDSGGADVYTMNITELTHSAGTLISSTRDATFNSLSIDGLATISTSGYGTFAALQIGTGSITLASNGTVDANGYTGSFLTLDNASIDEDGNLQCVDLDASGSADVLALLVNGGTRISSSGYFIPVSSNEVSAPNNSIFYSTVLSKLVYKDSGGTTHALY